MSWSFELDYNLSFDEAEEKLKKFKETIKLKSKTTAFGLVPVYEAWIVRDSEECCENIYKFDMWLRTDLSKTKVFSKVFPDIPLICLCIPKEKQLDH